MADIAHIIGKIANMKDAKFTETFQNNPAQLGPVGEHGSVSDAIVHAVGMLSEKVILSNGCVVEVEDGILTSYVYNNVHQSQVPVDQFEMGVGTFVSLVHLKPYESCALSSSEIVCLGRRIGQHIVGADPSAVSSEEGEGETSSPLLGQSFLLDSSVTVGTMMKKDGVEVLGFTRHGVREKERVAMDRTSALSLTFSDL